jgi:hypothetical protein
MKAVLLAVLLFSLLLVGDYESLPDYDEFDFDRDVLGDEYLVEHEGP